MTPLLPDMRQAVPSSVQVAKVGAEWQLGFASEVYNDGPGYLKITGTGPGDAPMDAVEQTLQMSDGSSTAAPVAGVMHYVIGGGHEHWHLMDFERYELRSAADAGTTILQDQKTGFCLADAFTADLCGRYHPELTTVSEGIGAGGSDTYLGYLEGQYLVLDPATVPAGDYLLVNRVNPTGALQDEDASNDAASVRLHLAWDDTGKPAIRITNKCPGQIDCPPPPDPMPTSDPGEPQQPTVPAPVIPTPEPEQVPIVPPSQFAPPAAAQASMSRSMAGRLVRRAIERSTNSAPRRLWTTCARRTLVSFACRSNWRDEAGTRWGGRVRVWYRVQSARLSWFYGLTAVRHSDRKRVVTAPVQGSASRAIFEGPSGSLYCARQRP